MRHIRTSALIVSIAVLVASCAAETAVTSLIVESTSSTDSLTTTSDLATTTTTDVTTTTSTPPEGAAVIASFYFVLGWWADGAWHQEAEYRPLSPGMSFEVLGIGEAPFSTVGKAPEQACEWSSDDIRRIPFDFENSHLAPKLAVSAPWSITEGDAEPIEADQKLIDIAVGLLSDVGIDEPAPIFVQSFETDLDNDGATETLAVLDNMAGVFDAPLDAYGIAFYVGDDGLVDVIGEYDTYADRTDAVHVVSRYQVMSVVDINLDGRDEIGLAVGSFESGGETVYELDATSNSLVAVLSQGCGV